MESLLRLPVVMKRSGLARSTIYKKMADNTFPKQRSLGCRSVGWMESEIDAWVNNREEPKNAKWI